MRVNTKDGIKSNVGVLVGVGVEVGGGTTISTQKTPFAAGPMPNREPSEASNI